jgi:hypothetical protein
MEVETAGLYEDVKFGIEVESFLSGKVGGFLINRAHMEIDAAVEELKRADPYDAVKIQELQNRIWRAESIDKWLAEKIQEGWNAEEHLRNQEA